MFMSIFLYCQCIVIKSFYNIKVLVIKIIISLCCALISHYKNNIHHQISKNRQIAILLFSFGKCEKFKVMHHNRSHH